ncbi:MAG: ABC transporter permease [Alphaproteobacteria bacterium]
MMYLVKRLLNMIPLLIGITLVSFAVMQLAPGDPGSVAADLNPKISPEMVEKLRAHFGLNQPWYMQYWAWLTKIAVFDFGTSFAPDGLPVLDKIVAHLPVTLVMNVIGLVVVLLISVPMGVAAARWQNGVFDRVSTILVFIGFAAPSFWLGLLAMMYLGVELDLLPMSGLHSFGSEAWPWWQQGLDYAHHLVLPITIGVIGSLAGMTRYLRATMLEVLRQEFITTARAKGAHEGRVLWRHALGNALLPVITILGLSIPGLIGGSVIVESLFSIPGMGKLFYEGVMMRDYPLIMGILTLGAILTLIGNLLADMLYAWADPRIRTQ